MWMVLREFSDSIQYMFDLGDRQTYRVHDSCSAHRLLTVRQMTVKSQPC